MNKNKIYPIYILLFLIGYFSGFRHGSNHDATKHIENTHKCTNDDNLKWRDTVYVYNNKTDFHKPEFKSEDVEKGQVWVYERNCDNPFEETIRDTLYIIDVKNDFVKYKGNGGIENSRISFFKMGSHRIK